jgi:subtilisin family serine protease
MAGPKTRRARPNRGRTPVPTLQKPSETLDLEVLLSPSPGGLSLLRAVERPSYGDVNRYKADPDLIARAVLTLRHLGFDVTSITRFTISVKGSRELVERVFQTKLSVFRQKVHGLFRPAVEEFYYPGDAATWTVPAELADLVEDAYIQWPPIRMAANPFPPRVQYHHLRMPGDMSCALNADRVHRAGSTGKGVKVAMVDTGFFTDHPYFAGRGYNMSVALAPNATDATRDGNGHGTAECANILAVAPNVTFIGIKMDNEQDPSQGASLAEGLKLAVAQSPDIITVSQGYDLVVDGSRTPLTALPNSLKPLEAEVKAAVQAGIVVIFSAGNGHVSFPGMMPDVLSAGGTFMDEDGAIQASDYASAFTSAIYPGRDVPDVTGLVGMMNTLGAYLMLPVEPGCEIDTETAQNTTFADGTAADDGWTVISGTSAAAPQLAGVCALLKEKNPGLTPDDVKQVIMRTARDVLTGTSNPASNNGTALQAGPGKDGATGDGLVDAFAAWKQV